MYRFNSFTQKANDVLNLAIKAAENLNLSKMKQKYQKTSILFFATAPITHGTVIVFWHTSDIPGIR